MAAGQLRAALPIAGLLMASWAGPAHAQGNVTVRMDRGGNLLVDGDSADNGIFIKPHLPGEGAVEGLGGTLVNGQASASFSGLTGNVRIRMRGGNDTVEIDDGDAPEVPADLDIDTGTGNDGVLVRQFVVRGDLSIRTGAGDDVVTLSQETGGSVPFVDGRTRIRTSSGNDQVLFEVGTIPDTYLQFGDDFDVATGPGRDFVDVLAGSFLAGVNVDLGGGDDLGTSGGTPGGLCVCNAIFGDPDVLGNVRFSGGDGKDGGVIESTCGIAPPGVVDDYLDVEEEPDDCSFLGGAQCAGSCR